MCIHRGSLMIKFVRERGKRSSEYPSMAGVVRATVILGDGHFRMRSVVFPNIEVAVRATFDIL